MNRYLIYIIGILWFIILILYVIYSHDYPHDE